MRTSVDGTGSWLFLAVSLQSRTDIGEMSNSIRLDLWSEEMDDP
jgi:hypothetical protein